MSQLTYDSPYGGVFSGPVAKTRTSSLFFVECEEPSQPDGSYPKARVDVGDD